jgi:hypothetical protein
VLVEIPGKVSGGSVKGFVAHTSIIPWRGGALAGFLDFPFGG